MVSRSPFKRKLKMRSLFNGKENHEENYSLEFLMTSCNQNAAGVKSITKFSECITSANLCVLNLVDIIAIEIEQTNRLCKTHSE